MDARGWFMRYFEQYQALGCQPTVVEQLLELKDLLKRTQARGRKVICAGNGGSAAIASHCAVDFTTNGRIRCINFNEADLITCLANDYGYEHWLEKAVEFYADLGDLLILISSSGKSKNMVNAARVAVSKGVNVVTFTGFAWDNPLRSLGQLNLWVESKVYNVVETIHQMWLLAVCDSLVAEADEGARQVTSPVVPTGHETAR